MTPKPTPRTDANVAALTKAPDCYCEAEFARQLERENQTFRAAQKACDDCDAPRVDRIDELERELAEARDTHAALYADTLAALYAGTLKLESELATAREALESLNKPKPTDP